jgi:hypothetical protein
MKSINIISEDLCLENNQTWIIDIFRDEFKEYATELNMVDNPAQADIVPKTVCCL